MKPTLLEASAQDWWRFLKDAARVAFGVLVGMAICFTVVTPRVSQAMGTVFPLANLVVLAMLVASLRDTRTRQRLFARHASTIRAPRW